MATYKAAYVGTGMIGIGLAANAAVSGFDVTLYDVVPVEKVKENFKKVLDILVEAGATTKEVADKAFENAKYSTDLKEAVKGVDYVQECIPERLQLKQDTYRAIQEVTGPDTLIFSSTSAMPPSQLSDGALYPGSIMVGHPYNPSYLLPLIEICGPQCPQENIDKARVIFEAMGKVTVVCRKERNGFVVNPVSWAALDAAKLAVKEGYCSVEDMDKAIIFGPGMRMAVTGQLLTMSLGVDGGFYKFCEKYGWPEDPFFQDLGKGVDEELANRDPAVGNTVEEVTKFRDRCFAQILKLHGKL